jgi:uncharacterized protein (TIGR03435 family)
MKQELFFLLNHLWQSTLVAAIAWLACRTMLRTNSARVRFRVWLATSLKFLIPFAAFVEIGHWLTVRPVLSPAQSQHVFDLVGGGTTIVAAAPFRVAQPPQAGGLREDVVLAVLAAVWAIGAAVVLFRWLKAWWTIRSAAHNGEPAGSFRGIPVLTSQRLRDQQIEPGVFGIWRQTILIPGGMVEGLGPAQFEAVLTHEWNHAKRRDNLTAALQMIVEAVFWFYPVVWMVGRRLIEERELACDEAVLEQAAAEDYAAGILNVCRLYHASPFRCVAGISGANLRARVESILRNERPHALNKARRWALVAALFVAVAGPVIVGLLTSSAFAQQGNSFLGLATSADKKFEVATVKLNQSDPQDFQLGPPVRGSIRIVNVALRGIIIQSFRTQRPIVFGIPSWAESERYDIVGKGPDSSATNPEVWEMMRSLLIERFHLKYHVENREMPVYALTVLSSGHKLTLGENGRCAAEIRDGKTCGGLQGGPSFGTAIYNMPIGALITGIGARAGRPIIDKTGLTGRYDAKVMWLPDGVKLEDLNLEGIPPEDRPKDISLFDALQQQVGLKLQPDRAAVPVLVVDSVARPDPN